MATAAMLKKQLPLFPEHQPSVDMSVIKSALQKAFRRNHEKLFTWAFNWGWELDHKWVVWRAPILTAEEAWRGLAETGRVCRTVDTILTSKNPEGHKKAKEMLFNHLLEVMRTKKNKDGDGMRIIAEIAAQKEGRHKKNLLEAVEKKVKPDMYASLLKMVEVEEFIFKTHAKFVKKEVWAEIWDRVEKLGASNIRSAEEYQELRDLVGAAYFRGKKGGMAGDLSLLVSVSYLTMDDYEHGTYDYSFIKGLGLDASEHALIEDDFDGNPQSIPPWFVADAHTGPGKRMMAYMCKVYPQYTKLSMQWQYFLRSSARVNETDSRSVWWDLAVRVVTLSYGFSIEEMENKWWPEWRERIERKTTQWLLEGENAVQK